MPGQTPNFTPLFGYTPILASVQLSGTNSSRDGLGTGTFFVVCSGNNFGTKIEYLTIRATGTTTTSVIRFFIDNTKVPSQYNTGIRLWNDIAVTAVTSSNTASSYSSELSRNDGRPILILSSGQYLTATAEKGYEGINIFAHGADF